MNNRVICDGATGQRLGTPTPGRSGYFRIPLATKQPGLARVSKHAGGHAGEHRERKPRASKSTR
jgi:hypothetical protein